MYIIHIQLLVGDSESCHIHQIPFFVLRKCQLHEADRKSHLMSVNFFPLLLESMRRTDEFPNSRGLVRLRLGVANLQYIYYGTQPAFIFSQSTLKLCRASDCNEAVHSLPRSSYTAGELPLQDTRGQA